MVLGGHNHFLHTGRVMIEAVGYRSVFAFKFSLLCGEEHTRIAFKIRLADENLAAFTEVGVYGEEHKLVVSGAECIETGGRIRHFK